MLLRDMIDANGHCEIPEGTKAIQVDAFCGCISLKSVRIPDSCARIGGFAFSGCTALASVTIPDSVTAIGYSAFRFCSLLKSVVIPVSVAAIGDNAFRGCTSLPSVELTLHTAVLVDEDWLQIGCKCQRLQWWESGDGMEFAMWNGYREEEYEAAIKKLRKLCNCKI